MKALGKGSIASFVRWGLGAAWWIMWFLAAALAIAAVAYAVLLTLAAMGIVDASFLTKGHGQINFGQTGHMSIDFDDSGDATWPAVIAGFLIGGVTLGGGLVIVWRLRQLFTNFSSGQPFHKANADHLRAIWIALLTIEVSRYVLMAVVGALAVAFSPPDGPHLVFDHEHRGVDFTAWFAILILIVLAEVFREGARLREEQELTI